VNAAQTARTRGGNGRPKAYSNTANHRWMAHLLKQPASSTPMARIAASHAKTLPGRGVQAEWRALTVYPGNRRMDADSRCRHATPARARRQSRKLLGPVPYSVARCRKWKTGWGARPVCSLLGIRFKIKPACTAVGRPPSRGNENPYRHADRDNCR